MPAFEFNSQGIDPHYGGGSNGLPNIINGQPVKHPVVIVGSALKPTRDQQGGYMELTLECIDGPCKGQTQVDRLNLQNKSADAVRIANQQLSAYCAVTGVFAFRATEELHGKPFVIETKPSGDKGTQFEVAKLYDMAGNEAGKAGSGAPQQQGGFQAPPPQQQQQGAGPASQPGWAGNGQPQQQQGGGWNQGGGQQQPQTNSGQPGWGNR